MPRRGENIYKRKDGRWEARYVKEILPSGKKKYGSVYADSYKEAKNKQQLCLMYPTHKSAAVSATLRGIFPLWFQGIKHRVKPNTYLKYEGIYNNHIDLEMGNIGLKYISTATIVGFTEKLLSKGLSCKTVNDILIVLNLLLVYASEEYMLKLPKVKLIKAERKETRFLSLSEQRHFTEYLKCNMDIHKFGILLALYTGIRIGELCALKWEDITDDFIDISKTMMRIKNDSGKTEIIISSPKSESSKRIIPTPKSMLALIKRFRSNGYVLSNDRLNYTEPRLMQIKFEKLAKECKLQNVSFHTLRHTFATRCVEAGVDAKTLSEILGHADVKTTLNRYVHPSFELKKSGMSRLEEMMLA